MSSGASATSGFSSVFSNGSVGSSGTNGGNGGVNGGNFGGLIGINGGVVGGLGGGGFTTAGAGGGGTRVKPSGEGAKPGDCELGTKTRRPCVPLVQPLGSKNKINVQSGAKTFIDYFNEATTLIITLSVGFAVLWILIGSYFIMVSGSDGGKRTTGKSMITWAMIGLILVNFAGFFLRTLNDIFFI